jgi:4-hydroxy-2-oxoheptanedioate aldolase
MLRRSRVLESLRAGKQTAHAKLNLADPRVIEICGIAGVPCVWICNEHVPNTWLNIENQIRAAKLYDVDTIVRVEKGCYNDFIKPFEADATGIMVPHVVSADEAREIVEWTKFFPLGKRALDGGNSEGRYCQIPMDEYINHSNTERFVILQIESPEALENVDEIAAVEGYEMLCFGPGDFSQRIGKPGDMSAPEIADARKKVAAAAKKHGKVMMAPGMMAPKEVLDAEGFMFYGLGADVISLSSFFKGEVENFFGKDATTAATQYDVAK